jgi:hypothetical protein
MPEKSMSAPDNRSADRLVALPGAAWAFWRRVGLRGSGFPADLARRLSRPECTAAADDLRAVEEGRDAVRMRARVWINTALDGLRQAAQWEDKMRRKALLDGLRDVNKGRVPAVLLEAFSALAGELAQAETAAAAARTAFVTAYDAAVARQSVEIHGICRQDPFREALLWQNRNAFHSALESLARHPPVGARNSQRRQKEEMIASYVQRYALKNDTIGFFGPMGWARFGNGPLRVEPGPGLVSKREVFLETWAFEELARTLSREPAVRPWLTPRVMSFARLGSGTDLHLPFQRPIRLPPQSAALLRACRGARTAREIAGELGGSPGFSGDEEVYRLLEQLTEGRLIEWSFWVPVNPQAGEGLRRQIERIGEESLRDAGLQALDELDAARQGVARAAGDIGALDRALQDLESTFERLTGARGSRRGGETYAGRTLVYEDCLRDLDVEFGPEVQEGLAKPLPLVLASVRWFTFRAAAQARIVLAGIYRELARQDGPRVEMVHFWYRFQPLLFEQKLSIADTVVSELHRRWKEVLGVTPEQRRLQLTSDQLAERVGTAFAAPGPGWPAARYHNPDLMIAAAGLESLRRGDFQLVLGELHAAACSLNNWVFMALCPQREEVFQDLDADLAGSRVVFLEPRNLPGVTGRTRRAYFSPKDVFILPLQETVLTPPAGQTLAMSELVVQRRGEELVVSSRNGRFQWEIVDFFGDIFSGYLATEFGLLGPSRHWPRVTVDRLILWRESWSFEAPEIEFAREPEGAGRFLGARHWAEFHGMPRSLFVKVAVEEKPLYVDFDSPISVELLAKALRRTADAEGSRVVKFTEMLPAIEDLWLPDAEGNRYTCELRVVALDRA